MTLDITDTSDICPRFPAVHPLPAERTKRTGRTHSLRSVRLSGVRRDIGDRNVEVCYPTEITTRTVTPWDTVLRLIFPGFPSHAR